MSKTVDEKPERPIDTITEETRGDDHKQTINPPSEVKSLVLGSVCSASSYQNPRDEFRTDEALFVYYGHEDKPQRRRISECCARASTPETPETPEIHYLHDFNNGSEGVSVDFKGASLAENHSTQTKAFAAVTVVTCTNSAATIDFSHTSPLDEKSGNEKHAEDDVAGPSSTSPEHVLSKAKPSPVNEAIDETASLFVQHTIAECFDRNDQEGANTCDVVKEALPVSREPSSCHKLINGAGPGGVQDAVDNIQEVKSKADDLGSAAEKSSKSQSPGTKSQISLNDALSGTSISETVRKQDTPWLDGPLEISEPRPVSPQKDDLTSEMDGVDASKTHLVFDQNVGQSSQTPGVDKHGHSLLTKPWHACVGEDKQTICAEAVESEISRMEIPCLESKVHSPQLCRKDGQSAPQEQLGCTDIPTSLEAIDRLTNSTDEVQTSITRNDNCLSHSSIDANKLGHVAESVQMSNTDNPEVSGVLNTLDSTDSANDTQSIMEEIPLGPKPPSQLPDTILQHALGESALRSGQSGNVTELHHVPENAEIDSANNYDMTTFAQTLQDCFDPMNSSSEVQSSLSHPFHGVSSVIDFAHFKTENTGSIVNDYVEVDDIEISPEKPEENPVRKSVSKDWSRNQDSASEERDSISAERHIAQEDIVSAEQIDDCAVEPLALKGSHKTPVVQSDQLRLVCDRINSNSLSYESTSSESTEAPLIPCSTPEKILKPKRRISPAEVMLRSVLGMAPKHRDSPAQSCGESLGPAKDESPKKSKAAKKRRNRHERKKRAAQMEAKEKEKSVADTAT
jgi:hypothetical protein